MREGILGALLCTVAHGAAFDWSKVDESYHCPKQFVPGRPGGFMSHAAKEGCCLLDASLNVAETIYMMHECGIGRTEEPLGKVPTGGVKREARFTRNCMELQPLPHVSTVRACCDSSNGACSNRLDQYEALLTPPHDETAVGSSVFAMYQQCVEMKEYLAFVMKDPAYAECRELRMLARQAPEWDTKEKVPAAYYPCEEGNVATAGQLEHMKDAAVRTAKQCHKAQTALFKIVRFLHMAAHDMYELRGPSQDLTPQSKTMLAIAGLKDLERFMTAHHGMEYDLVDKKLSSEAAFVKELKRRRAVQDLHAEKVAFKGIEKRDMKDECEMHPYAFAHCRTFFSKSAWDKLAKAQKTPAAKRKRCIAIIKGATAEDINRSRAKLQGCWDFLGPRDKWNDPVWEFFCDMHPAECEATRKHGKLAAAKAKKTESLSRTFKALASIALGAKTDGADDPKMAAKRNTFRNTMKSLRDLTGVESEMFHTTICSTRCTPACEPCSQELRAQSKRQPTKLTDTQAWMKIQDAAQHMTVAQLKAAAMSHRGTHTVSAKAQAALAAVAGRLKPTKRQQKMASLAPPPMHWRTKVKVKAKAQTQLAQVTRQKRSEEKQHTKGGAGNKDEQHAISQVEALLSPAWAINGHGS